MSGTLERIWKGEGLQEAGRGAAPGNKPALCMKLKCHGRTITNRQGKRSPGINNSN